ncbi:hypothetical protein F5B17DRAFT_401731 [Nemania serpens]|nr:hypothetical protein F5B17DRAFT_401731 [Nemania serpens]
MQGDLTSAPDEDREGDNHSKMGRDLFEAGDLQGTPSQREQASPALPCQSHLCPSTTPTSATASILVTRPVSARIGRFYASQWRKHRAPIFMLVAQFFGAVMNLFARLLELGEADTKLHPMQLLFWRMLLSTVVCVIYIVWRQIPHGVLGDPEVRWLLAIRGITGFFGIYGVWYSIQYLPLSEATVITFIAPNLAGYWCHIFLKDPYTRTEQLASLLSLGGVVLITKPASLFSAAIRGEETSPVALETLANATAVEIQRSATTGPTIVGAQELTTSAHLTAIGVALLGVLGTSFAFTTLRAIGTRAHPLLSVNYFNSLCIIVTFSVLSLASYLDIGQPEIRFGCPSSMYQWGLLLLVTASGLILQVLTTKGLAAERSNRATAMTYTQVLFAAGFDRLVWGTTMSWMSTTGCMLIIAGAVWVATAKKGTTKKKWEEEGPAVESVPMLGGEPEDQRDDIVLETMRQ